MVDESEFKDEKTEGELKTEVSEREDDREVKEEKLKRRCLKPLDLQPSQSAAHGDGSTQMVQERLVAGLLRREGQECEAPPATNAPKAIGAALL